MAIRDARPKCWGWGIAGMKLWCGLGEAVLDCLVHVSELEICPHAIGTPKGLQQKVTSSEAHC